MFGKYKHYLHDFLKKHIKATLWRDSLTCFTASTNSLIPTMYEYCVYTAVPKSQKVCQIVWKEQKQASF